MKAGQEYLGMPVYSLNDGRHLGTVKDLYFDEKVQTLTGLYLGPEGLLSRKAKVIAYVDISVFGIDAILAKHASTVVEKGKIAEAKKWVRRDLFPGRQVASSGGTKFGTINDILVDNQQQVLGFTLRRVFVHGPVAENNAIAREAVIELSDKNKVMIVDLEKAEKQTLNI